MFEDSKIIDCVQDSIVASNNVEVKIGKKKLQKKRKK